LVHIIAVDGFAFDIREARRASGENQWMPNGNRLASCRFLWLLRCSSRYRGAVDGDDAAADQVVSLADDMLGHVAPIVLTSGASLLDASQQRPRAQLDDGRRPLSSISVARAH
jgi:hypothetical protein